VNATNMVWPIINSFLLETFILFLLASGFFLVHRTAKFLNVAHGDYATLGAYLIFTLTSGIGMSVWVALIPTIAVIGLLAIIIDKFTYRYLRGAPLALLLCSIGVALVVRYGVFMVWGGRFKKLPVALQRFQMYNFTISGDLILAIVFGLIIISAAYYVFHYTALGVSVRAVADNPQLAESFGMDTEKIIKFVWLLSGASAAVAGIVLGLYRPLTFEMGFHWILLIIAVSILAGEKLSFLSLLGACAIITGAMELGLFIVPEAYRMGIGFAMLVIAIIVRGGLKR
jgi:branched-chain amino acid transport system permease protein